MTAFAARAVWTPQGVLHDGVVEVGPQGQIVAVRPWVRGEVRRLDGMIVPGLVNAHTHVELSGAAVPGGAGFLPWLAAMRAGPSPLGGAEAACQQLVAAGVAWVHDVSNQGGGAAALARAGLAGVAHTEVLGFDRDAVQQRGAMVRNRTLRPLGAVQQRFSPHALFSTAPELFAALCRSSRAVPATVHVGEAEHEAAFVQHGSGPMAELLDALGHRWRHGPQWHTFGPTPLAAMDALGLLGPGLLLVHGVRLGAADLRRAAVRGAAICLCPRSNLHIGGDLPDVRAMVAAGLRLAIGTDGLVSCPDLDPLAEVSVLAQAFAEVPADRWLAALTHEGAAVTGAPAGVGRIEPGAAPGLVLLHGVRGPSDLAKEAPSRQWLVQPNIRGAA